MDSINRNQPEQNHEDLATKDAVKKIKEIVDKAQTCFFCTNAAGNAAVPTRPMHVQELDAAGQLWFLSASDSHKNAEIASDPSVRLYFQEGPHAGFLTLDGTATVSQDRERIRALWKPILKTWFTEGEDDPRITVIRVAPHTGYYWDHKHGQAVAGVKMLIGAAIGKTLDDSIEGRISV